MESVCEIADIVRLVDYSGTSERPLWKRPGDAGWAVFLEGMAKILVVDDHEETRHLLQRVLKHFGHEASCASDGKQALASLCAHVPDLVILDLSMPGISGTDVLREIRGGPRTASLPVIIFSAYPDTIYKEIALRAGASAYWVKGSIELAEMQGAIEQILEKCAASTKLNANLAG